MSTVHRFRNKSDLGIEPQIIRQTSNFGGAEIQNVDVKADHPYFTISERMWDAVEKPKSAIYFPDHPCVHFRTRGSCDHVKSFTTFYLTAHYEQLRWSVRPELVESLVPGIPTNLLDEFAESALTKFTSDIEQNSSLLNFLYELKDFRQLFGAFSGLLSRFLQWISKPGLTWSFVIKPMLEDVKKLIGVHQKVKRRLAFLIAHNGEVVTMNYNVSDVVERIGVTVSDEAPVPWVSPEGFPDGVPVLSYADIKFKAHAKVKINCKYLKRLDKKIDAYMTALGLASLGQWLEAWYHGVPFTWLIDYFVRTRRILRHLRSPVYQDVGVAPLEVLTSSHSIRTRATVLIWAVNFPSSTPEKVGKYNVAFFTRHAGLPFEGEGGWLRYHNLSQNSDMLAILLQIILPGLKLGRR